MADNKYADWDYVNDEYQKAYEKLQDHSDWNVANGVSRGLSNQMNKARLAYKDANRVEGTNAPLGYDRAIDEFIKYSKTVVEDMGSPGTQFGNWNDADRHYVGEVFKPLVEYMKTEAAKNDDLGGEHYKDLMDIGDAFDAYSELPCFTAGTLISTPKGEVLVEHLRVGDEVNTLSGPRALKWIGHRRLNDLASLPEGALKDKSAPIMIRAGALEDGMPSRDMRVSPWHHMYVQGVLARAMDLVNGQTIYSDTSVNAVTYYHLELEGAFDVIEACGTYSESFADNGKNRRGFFASEGVVELRPADAPVGGMSPRPGFTVVRPNKNGDVLKALQQRYAARAEQLDSVNEQVATA
ncbi:Hint domain-containing protein [Carnimonas bestiolae]|uniref:Hint domain-containing protein n=1 Tax=Carnimonas bestiolae TaxID=3402172 RepID=UPI003EDB8F3A